MARYIELDALVAEIERLRDKKGTFYASDVLYNLEDFINTLEVKGVDLNKEIGEYLSTYWCNEKELHPFLGHMAKHFFELGMQVSYKAQKGE